MYNTDLLRIKREANIDTLNLDFDTDLLAALEEASRWMDLKLSAYTAVPLTSPVLLIQDIEAKIGAGLFKERRTIPVEGERTRKHIIRETGETWLADYIKATYAPPAGANRAARMIHGKDYRRLRIDAAGQDTDETLEDI
jgi:hypothetical protein